MRSTLECKQAQLANGYFETGTGPLQVLILGSCRTLAYLNYLEKYNLLTNAMTIRRIDPCDFGWDAQNNPVNAEEVIARCETDRRILAMLSKTQVFIHEYYRYYGMFNTDKEQVNTIYDFGMNPQQDICIPNFHDRFVLFQELVNVDAYTAALMRLCDPQDNALGVAAIRNDGLDALDKFYDICAQTSFPEFADIFRNDWTKRRYFWTANHTGRPFTLGIFRLMNEKFLHLTLDKAFWDGAGEEDQFCSPCTPVTKWDVEAYGLTWENMTIEELRLP